MSKKGRLRGGRTIIAAMGAKATSGSRHMRRAEKAKAKLEAKGYKFPEEMK